MRVTAEVHRHIRPAIRPIGTASGDGWLDVVVHADSSEEAVRVPLEDTDSRLRCQVPVAPADAVVLHGAAHPVVGHRTGLHADAAPRAERAGEERAQLA